MKNRLKYFFKTIKGSLTAKIIFGILFFMLSLGTVLITIAQKWFTDAVEDNYRKHLDRATKSLYTDFEDYMYDNDFNLDIHTEEYAEFYRMMSNTCLLQDLQYISVIQPIENYTKELFLFDVINVLDGPEQEFYYGYIQDIVSPEYSEAYRKIFEEKGSSVLIVRKGKGVKTPHISEMIPLHDKNTGEVIAVLETQILMTEMNQVIWGYRLRSYLAMLIIGAISSQICWLYLRRQFVHPLQQITAEATRFAREKHMSETSLTEQIRTGTEIGRLAENIDRMEKQTEDHVRAIRELTLDTERVERELELGAAIQSATLLSGLDAVKGRDEFEISAYMDPAREVGGDFYDYFFVDDDHLAVLIADVSGKGMPAALYMMTCKIGLKTVISRGGTPAERLAMFNDLLCEENIADMFVSVWLGIIEISTGKMTAANAGHEYPIFRRRGEEQDMFALYKDKHGLVLGAMEGVRYRNYEVDLKPGDFLFVYTDGVAEANNADHELFGTERTCMALNRDPDCGPDGLITNVREEINRFVKDEPQFDDITMLCLQWKGKGMASEPEQ